MLDPEHYVGMCATATALVGRLYMYSAPPPYGKKLDAFLAKGQSVQVRRFYVDESIDYLFGRTFDRA